MTITDTVKQKKPKHKLLEKYTIKERTRKQKADIFMGIVFQIYLCIPWININGKYNTIHMYLIKAFRQNDYVDIYIQTFLKNHTWPQQYSRMALSAKEKSPTLACVKKISRKDDTMVAFEDFIAIPINKAIKLMVTMTTDFKSN